VPHWGQNRGVEDVVFITFKERSPRKGYTAPPEFLKFFFEISGNYQESIHKNPHPLSAKEFDPSSSSIWLWCSKLKGFLKIML
jgi:hypothetical protein